MWVVSVPISVPVSKNKRFYLNLNVYRNAHHQVLSKAKVKFHELTEPLVRHLPKMGQVRLTFTLFAGSKGLVDTANICSIVDKFFSDVLVNTGKLADDNCHIVIGSNYEYGGVDAHHPRCEVSIQPVSETRRPNQQEKPSMQIILKQIEIEQAITEFVGRKLRVNDDQRVDIDLKATRGEDGYQAFIDIVDQDAERIAPAPEPEEAPAPAAKVTATVTGRKTRTATTAAVKAEPEVPAPQPEPEVSEANGTKEEELVEEAPAAPKNSIFGNLSRPSNS